jgi:hypothetical protein
MPALYSPPATATRSFHFVTVRDTPLVDGIFFHVSVLSATLLYREARLYLGVTVQRGLLTPTWIDKDSLRVKILARLRDFGPSSISALARGVQYPLPNVRDKLIVATRLGHVTSQTKPMIYASGQRVTIHEYKLTEDGKKWLELAAQS